MNEGGGGAVDGGSLGSGLTTALPWVCFGVTLSPTQMSDDDAVDDWEDMLSDDGNVSLGGALPLHPPSLRSPVSRAPFSRNDVL